VAAYFNIGAVASSGLFTPSIEESADNVTFAPTTNLSTALANTAQNTPQETAYLGSKRYVRAVATYVSGTSVAIAAVLIGARGALPS
ncbi:MAG TPA: hypothetical protein VHL53_16060, partial [Acidimicrobiia bacterium]|nr:hypothetical protein [Acidimicrobiia bacterium]